MKRSKRWEWGVVFLLIALSTTIMLAIADENQTTLENQTTTTIENHTSATVDGIAPDNLTSGNETTMVIENGTTNSTVAAPAAPNTTNLIRHPANTPADTKPPAAEINNMTVDTPSNPAVLNISSEADTAQQNHTVHLDNAFLEQHRDKLTRQTLRQLEASSDDQVHRFLLKHRRAFDKHALDALTDARGITTNIDAFQGTKGDLKQLLLDHDVDLIEIDQPMHILGDNAPWNVQRTGADQVWNQTNGTGVKVAILDTGIATHPDLVIAGGTSIVSDNYTDTNGHGTAVAGVVAAVADGQGLVGIAPAASLYAVKIMNDSSGSISDAIAGVQWAIDNNMSIIVMSFGMSSESEILKTTVQDASNHGILLIAASGNDGTEQFIYPAAYESVIAVGALTTSNQRADFSNYGLQLELSAPGVGINSTSLNNGYFTGSGTSFAAPHVAGVAALDWAYNPALTSTQLRGKLRNDARDLGITGRDDEYGFGLVTVNLTSTNYTWSDSYEYTLFNITNYGPNQTLTYWINGTGTIDDVTISPGYYLLQISKSANRTLFVDDNGSIAILVLLSPSLNVLDNWTGEGNFTDSVVWNDTRYIKMNVSVTAYGECWDYNFNGASPNWTSCFFANSTSLSACNLSSPCNNNHNCSVGGLGATHQLYLGPATKFNRSVAAETLDFSCNNNDANGYATATYYGIDAKRYNCTAGGNYTFQGKFGPNDADWHSYGITNSCATNYTCDPAVYRQTCTGNESCGLPTLCRKADGTSCNQDIDCLMNHVCLNSTCQVAPTCTASGGTIFISAEDSTGTPLASLSVYVNGAYNTSTDSIGTTTIRWPTATCGAVQAVQLRCLDNMTVCDTKSATVTGNGFNDSVAFTCDLCSTPDLSISPEDVFIDNASGNITVQVHDANFTATNLNVSIFLQSQGVLTNSTSKLVNISGTSIKNVSFSINLTGTQYVNVYLDPNQTLKESKVNDYVIKPVITPVKAFINMHIDTTSATINQTVYDYIASYVIPVTNATAADVLIDIGHLTSGIGQSPSGCTGCTLPYSGMVKLQCEPNGSTVIPHIYAQGNGLDGDLAAVKRLINARNLFLTSYACKNASGQALNSFINDYDSLGIGVADHLHNTAAQATYNQNSTAFAETVRKILYDNNYEISIMTVKTLSNTTYGNSTILRIKHVSTDFSQDYQSAINPNATTPVVFSGGIFSDLETWEHVTAIGVQTNNGLARQLANNGRDVWEIEMTGGPYTDCVGFANDTCPNYNYSDLVDFYWPASIAGIIKYSGKASVDYVAHSNGGRAALTSLNKYSNTGLSPAGYYFDYTNGSYVLDDLPSRPVNRFIGVAVPTVLNGPATLLDFARSQFCFVNMSNDHATTHLVCSAATNAATSMSNIRARNITHLTMRTFIGPIYNTTASNLVVRGTYDQAGNDTISSNLMQYYSDTALNTSTTFNLSGVNVTAIYLFYVGPEDIIVPVDDENVIVNSTPSSVPTTALTNNQSFYRLGVVPREAVIKRYNHAALTYEPTVLANITRWLQ
jgi:subtilisin